jgi:hypothetical protein
MIKLEEKKQSKKKACTCKPGGPPCLEQKTGKKT